jgi:hypothetical protein
MARLNFRDSYPFDPYDAENAGSTDPLAGFAATTANLVVGFYFAKRGFENVARIMKR